VIHKQDILDRVGEWHLRADVVERDYVLAWVLAAISSHPETSVHWVFKGGTCLKKCYFETYRFSEDLDFSLTQQALYTAEDLRRVLLEVTEIAHDLSGIEFAGDAVVVRERKDKAGRTTFEGKIGYRGPLLAPFFPRILFDLTQHEPILAEPVACAVFHPYPDALPSATTVRAYSLEELLGEKLRALIERTRPRDLYDVVYILNNHSSAIRFEIVSGLYREKCRIKGFEPLSSEAIVQIAKGNEELASEWANMLAHQLPQLPPLAMMLDRLGGLLGWLDVPKPSPPLRLTPVPARAGESLLAPIGVRYWGSGLPIEAIRFAGANRLLIEFNYHGKHRVAEPYSLRRPATGNLLLYAWERGAPTIKAFKVDEMSSVRAMNESFTPRFSVELTAGGPLQIPPSTTFTTRSSVVSSVPRGRRPRKLSRTGVEFRYECPVCGRTFRHSRQDSTLRPHKAPGGGRCSGRRGIFLGMG
jgi:predicted nucleotidyltransferase component of viral defense system